MELWACGFNAWNQLQCHGAEPVSDPHDLSEFSCVLKDGYIEILKTSVSAVLIRTSSGLKVTGCPDDFIKICSSQNGLPNVTVAGNDKIAVFNSNTLTEFSSFHSYISNFGTPLREFNAVKQLLANQTTFTLLSSTGTIYTWGDPRYPSCLGRDISENCQASLPCLVEDLIDLPQNHKIAKISTGGYVSAALTTSDDLYVWGGRPGQPKLLEQLEGTPTPIDIQGLDFSDVAVGDGHILALSTNHSLFIVGAGGNGQLGLGDDVKEAQDWMEISLPLKLGQKIIGVHAGYKTSFVIVQ